jgi:septal ring factor EnvC (AmiA/AmiB activator)
MSFSMTDIQRPRFDNKISFGNIFTLVSGVVAVGVIVGAVQSDVKALAQRLDATDKKIETGDKRDDRTAETLDTLKGAVIELRSDQKSIKNDIERQNRQLDRIEQLLQGGRSPPK